MIDDNDPQACFCAIAVHIKWKAEIEIDGTYWDVTVQPNW